MKLFSVTLVLPLRRQDKDQHYCPICVVMAESAGEAIVLARDEHASLKPLCAQARDLEGKRVVQSGHMLRSAVVVGGMMADPAWTKFAEPLAP